MFRPLARLFWAALYAAVVAAAFFVAVALGRLLITRGEVNWRAEAVARLVLLLAASAGPAASGAVRAAIAAKRRRRMLAPVEQQLAGLRNSPSPSAAAVRGGDGAAELADVRREADALAACYRQALAEV